MTRLSVVVPVWNRRELVLRCLRSVEAALADFDAELIVVDDGSTDGVADAVEVEHPAVRLLRLEANRGFAVAANRGMAEARGELLLLLNSDTELDAAALGAMTAHLEADPACPGVVPRLVDAEGNPRGECMAFPRPWTPLFFGSPLERWWPRSPELRRYFLRDFDPGLEQDVEQPPAACWLLRREVWQGIGPFDEALELFFNDVDWCARLATTGRSLRYLPGARVAHVGGASTEGREDLVMRWQTDRLRYQRKHFGRLGSLVAKACVSWSYLDWRWREGKKRRRGEVAEDVATMQRAFAAFLRS